MTCMYKGNAIAREEDCLSSYILVCIYVRVTIRAHVGKQGSGTHVLSRIRVQAAIEILL